jgi:PAS domain S-box-containing protein
MDYDFDRMADLPAPLNNDIRAKDGINHHPISVLYVDDEPALLDPIRHFLERKGTFSVDTTTSAKSALAKIRKNKYDVIVSDYQMPGMDGIQFLKKLRDEKNPIPFIIFTGKGHEEVVVEAYDAGADFYIPKGGNPRAMFLDLTQKITQIVTRRRSEEALLESEDRYRKVVEQSHDAIFIFQDSRIVFANERVMEITGYSQEELYSMDIWALLHPDDREYLMGMMMKRVKGHIVPKTYEARILTKTGETRYLEAAITALESEGRESLLGSVRDITERKNAEEALRKSEEKYHSIFDTFDDLYYQTDMQGTITILSPSCKRITGWDASELIGTQVLNLYPFPEQRKQLLDHMFENGAVHDYEVVLINKEGEHLNVSVTSHVVRDEQKKPIAIEGSLRNITNRIRVEKALAVSEARYRTLTDFLPVMIFETTLEGMVTFGNRLILPVFGVDPSALGPDINVFDYIVPEERKKARENMQKLFTGISRSSNEYTLIRGDGTTFPSLISASAIVDEKSGKPVGMRGVIIDLSERKETEQAIRESEELFRTLFNNANDAIFLHEIMQSGKIGNYIMANDVACTRLGYSHDEILALSPCDVVARSHHQRIPAITGEIQQYGHATFDAIYRKKDGMEFPVEVSSHGFEFHDKNVVLSVVRDITERKHMEEQLIASEKYLKTIFNSVQTALVIIDPKTHTIFDLNPAAVKLIGADKESLTGTACPGVICVAKKGRCPVTDQKRRFENSEHILITAKGEKVPVLKTVLPVTISGKQYLLENISDITDRKRAEDAMQKAYFELEQKVEERTTELSKTTHNLQEEMAERTRVMEALRFSEEKYRSLVEQTSDLVFQIARDGRITYINPNVETILGYTPGDVVGKKPTEFMLGSDLGSFLSLYHKTITDKGPVIGVELTFLDSMKRPHIFEINGTPHFDKENEVISFSGIARDITDRKALQDEIAASLKEKEILLKEIHHRVKNNMQVISSLLNLQVKLVKDEKSRDAIKESQNRVMSIALVHEKLYQSKSLARINFREYIKKMSENLFDSYNMRSDRIQLEINADDIILPINKAIPISLIINEMLSNSLKYAFPDNRTGKIEIRFRKEGDRHTLVVRDDGIGLPAGFSLNKTDTLGLQLVSSLVGQLLGTLSFSGDNGTEFRIEFTIEPSAGEHYE